MPPLKSLLHLAFCAVLSLAATIALGLVLNGASILLVENGRFTDSRTTDSSHLRQIGQASLIFADDNHGRLPNATDLPDYARQLAIGAGLDHAAIWIKIETRIPDHAGTVLEASNLPLAKRAINPAFAKLPHLFTVPLNGITSDMPATTPIGWTRGLDLETGHWRPDSPYGGKGGHIVFLGGNVQFFRDLTANGGGLLRFSDSKPTASIREALPPGVRISESAPPGEPTGIIERITQWMNSIGPRIPDALRATIKWLWLAWMLALFPTLTLHVHRATTPQPLKVPRLLKFGLLATPVLLLALSFIFQV